MVLTGAHNGPNKREEEMAPKQNPGVANRSIEQLPLQRDRQPSMVCRVFGFDRQMGDMEFDHLRHPASPKALPKHHHFQSL